MFPPASAWRTPRVSELPSFRDAQRVALDCETRDPHLTTLGAGSIRGDGEVVGFSYAIDGGPRRYVPLSHAGGDNVEDKWQAVGWLRDEAAAFRGELVGSKISYDLCWLLSMGVAFPHAIIKDIQVAEALIDELALRYGLEALCAKYDLPGKDEELMRSAAGTFRLGKTEGQVKANLWRLPARYVGLYAEGDVDRPLLILAKQEREIERQELGRAWALEQRVTPALLAIRRRGIRVDFDHLERVERYAHARVGLALDELNTTHAGPKLRHEDLNRSDALHKTLESCGIHNPYRTAAGKPSVTKEFLENCPGEAGKLIREAKRWDKLITTFCAGIKLHAIDGRIHCTYNQTKGEKEDGSGTSGAATFRLSCEDPNLQQQPGRDPEQGPLWRQVYVPDEVEPDAEWISCDFSQQEPRFTTHFAAEMDLPRAREAAQKFCDDRSTDNHQMMADLTGGRVKRKGAKEIYLGITYGQGSAKTATKMGMETAMACRPPREWGRPFGTIYYTDVDADAYHEASRAGGFTWEVGCSEAREIEATLDREVPYLRALAKKAQKIAKDRGNIRTFFGHIAHFPKDHPLADDLVRKALNRLIQVSSAGQTKEAVCQLHEAGEYVQLQVHDELGGSGSRASGRRWAEVMEGTAKLRLPSKVDAEFGRSWGESMLTPSEPAYVNAHAKVTAHMKELGI